jgi:hypothetical protein
MMTEIFYTFVITTGVGLIITLSRMCYKSKCKEINFGCLKIIRDTEAEEKELEFTTTHQIPRTDTVERDLNEKI